MSSITIDQVQVSATVCTAVAVLATFARLIIKRNTLGIDDIWVFLSIVAMCIKLGVIFNLSPSNITSILTYYLIVVTFYTSLWFSRISVLFSLIRVAPTGHQRVMYGIFAIFLALYFLLVGQTAWVCEGQRNVSSPCMPNREMAIFQILGDAFADLSLVGLSLSLFTIIQERGLRFRLMSIFSTCIGTTIVSLVHGLLILKNGASLDILVIAIVEATVSTIVANIPVLSTFVINLFPGLRSPSIPSRPTSIASLHINSLSLHITRESGTYAAHAQSSQNPRFTPSYNNRPTSPSRTHQTRISGSTHIFPRPPSTPTQPPDFEWNGRRPGDHPLISLTTRRSSAPCFQMELELNASTPSRHASSQDLKYDATPISYPPKCL